MLATTLCLASLSLAQLFDQPEHPTVPGVTLRVYYIQEDLQRLPVLIESQTPNAERVVPMLDLGNAGDPAAGGFGGFATGNGESIYATLTGWITPERPGAYTFRLTSDDGSRLTLNGDVAIDHDGTHGATAVESGPVELVGATPFEIEYFDHAGGQRLLLEWQAPGQSGFAPVPAGAFTTHDDDTRVTSPGFKDIEGGRRPGDGKPLRDAHPMWEVSTFRPLDFEPMVGAMCFDHRGRLIVGTFDPLQRDDVSLPDIEAKEPDSLYAVSPDGVEVVAEGFLEPAGLVRVGNDLYVSHRRAVTRLTDSDNDGFYETHTTVGEGWEGWNYHQFVFGLVHKAGPTRDHPGYLYGALSTAMAPPGWEGQGTNATVNGPMRGGIIEVDLSIGHPALATRVIAGGTRTPNGLGVGPEGTLWYADNQGTWMPTSQFSHVIPGRFYGHHNRTNVVPRLAERFPEGGHPSVYMDRARTPASILLPHGEASNSPTESVLIPDGPFKGQMLLAELTAGGIRRVFLEKVNGQYQGAVFRHSQGFEVGINRMVWGPDGALYVGGIGADGNWKWRETQFGLQKLTPTGRGAFEMREVRAMHDGFVVTFTEPVDTAWLNDPSNYAIASWAYAPDAEYGGPKVDQRTHAVTGARAGAGGRIVRLFVEGLEPGRCVELRLDPVSTENEPIWSTQAWYTLNQIPAPPGPGSAGRKATLDGLAIDPDTRGGVGVGVLPTRHGAPLIGASEAGAMRYASNDALARDLGHTAEEVMALEREVDVGFGTGDLVSAWEFGDCRLHVEWLSPPGGAGQLAGNSGVYLQGRYEVQVLGTRRPDQGGPGVPALNEAGAIYNVKTADTNASNGPGEWQAYDIFFRAPRFEDGEKVSDARMTVYWNGVLIHNDVPVPAPTGSAQGGGEIAPAGGTGAQTGPIRFQDHGSAAEGPVRYRNVWVEPLEPADYVPATGWTDLAEADWRPQGGNATYTIEDGVITGTSVPNTPNTYLTTTRDYADFELIFEVRQHEQLNSGVQIRSELVGEGRSAGLRGKQVELDPESRAYSAGIYDERGRAWIAPPADQPYARRAYRKNDWNRVRVVATGPLVRTWLNGVPVADMMDALQPSGRIGLQVHDVGNNQTPMTVEWRNLKIRELKPSN
ncbi:MAG: family 16 glycoside hydrolase [Phycisphaerales bacterium JB040]